MRISIMKRYLLPVAFCLYWATPIQAAEKICPTGPITEKCEKYFINEPKLSDGKEVVICIRAVQSGNQAVNAKCKVRLENAQNELVPAIRMGSDRDTSPMNFIQDALDKL